MPQFYEMDNERLKPVHPGEILLEEFLKPMNLSQNQIALALRVPARRINEIVHSKRRITADTALRLARYFGTSPRFWLGLQMDYDLDVAEDEIGDRLSQEVVALANQSSPLRCRRQCRRITPRKSRSRRGLFNIVDSILRL